MTNPSFTLLRLGATREMTFAEVACVLATTPDKVAHRPGCNFLVSTGIIAGTEVMTVSQKSGQGVKAAYTPSLYDLRAFDWCVLGPGELIPAPPGTPSTEGRQLRDFRAGQLVHLSAGSDLYVRIDQDGADAWSSWSKSTGKSHVITHAQVKSSEWFEYTPNLQYECEVTSPTEFSIRPKTACSHSRLVEGFAFGTHYCLDCPARLKRDATSLELREIAE